MTMQYEFESERLRFRHWSKEDQRPFQIINSDPDVMEFMPKILCADESDAFIGRIEKHFEDHGFGLWAVEEKATSSFIGYIGFYTAEFESEFTPCIEIGWRLAKEHWYKGYATEGAMACLGYGFSKLGLNEVYSFTSVVNTRSINVMEKIGLTKAGEFEHPKLEEGHPLRRHVLYHTYRST